MVVFGRATSSLLEELAAADSQAARLARELQAARARPVARLDVVATAGGEAQARAAAVTPGSSEDAPENSASGGKILGENFSQEPAAVVGTVEDGPLTARITYLPIDSVFRLNWTVRVPGELVHSLTGDGRLVVFARSSDPRVQWDVPAFEYELPEIEGGGVPWRWIFGAAIAAVVGWEVVRE